MYIDHGTAGFFDDAQGWVKRQYERGKDYKEKYDDYSKKAEDITDIIKGKEEPKKKPKKKAKPPSVLPAPNIPGVTPGMFWAGVGVLAVTTYFIVRR